MAIRLLLQIKKTDEKKELKKIMNEQDTVKMRFEIIEHDSAYDTIKDTVTGEEYTVVDTKSKKLLNLLNDYEYKKHEKTG